MEIGVGDIVLCKFYFSDLKRSKNRPVLVFRDGLPFDDFVAIPLSSKMGKLHDDELLLSQSKLQSGKLPVDSKQNPIKRYGQVKQSFLKMVTREFCNYFECAEAS